MIDYTGITQIQHAMIDDVMDNMDFNKIEKYMKNVKWGWSAPTPDDEWNLEIPDQPTIRQHLREQLVHCYRNLNKMKESDPDYDSCCYSSCGGFTTYVWANDDCQVFFAIEECMFESDCYK